MTFISLIIFFIYKHYTNLQESAVKVVQTSSQCCYIFSWPSGSMTPIHLVLRIEYRFRGRDRCCTFHYLSRTDSIKPSLQFSFLYIVWLLSRDRLSYILIFKSMNEMKSYRKMVFLFRPNIVVFLPVHY